MKRYFPTIEETIFGPGVVMEEDDCGDYVRYGDVVDLLSEVVEWNWGEEEYEHIPEELRNLVNNIINS